MARRLIPATIALLIAGALLPVLAKGQSTPTPEQDPVLLRLVRRAVAWYPNSSFRITANDLSRTPSGAYRIVTVERECDSTLLSGSMTVIVDEVARTAWIGNAARLPLRQAGVEPSGLGRFLADFLPDFYWSNRNQRVSVDWTSGPRRPGALIPFWLKVDTGYGEYLKESAVTSDGEYLVFGTSFSVDQDPVAFRRELLVSSDLVVWGHRGGGDERAEIVEFSDLECPHCRHKWPMVKESIDANGGAVRHGMVSFPLTAIHPWAFRSASASWCVAEQDDQLLLPFKELFYSLQTEMEVSLVTPTAIDFVIGNGLDEASFRSCYLRAPSLDAVHGQLTLGHRLGVVATPTYFVNGWKVQSSGVDEAWFPDMIDRLIAGEDLS